MRKIITIAKSNVKKILDSKYCEKLSNYYRQGYVNTNDIYKILIKNNNWIYTLPKTGTGYVCNVIAFYNALNKNNHSFNFDNIHEFGVLRGVHSNLENLNNYLNRDSQYQLFIHSHKYFEAYPENLIITTRSVLDQLVSNYYFSFKNKKNLNISVDDALNPLVNAFVDTYNNQKKAIRCSKKIHILRYEDLIINSNLVFAKLFRDLNGTLDQDNLNKAIDSASITNIKKFEKENDKYLYASTDKYSFKSFIRSGKIGEGEEFFTDNQKNYIFSQLDKNKISKEYSFEK